MKLLVYDFVGRGPNKIPRGFFRKLNSMLKDSDKDIQRIQKSVVLSAGGDLDGLKRLVEYYVGVAGYFR